MPLYFPPHRIAVPAATRAGTIELFSNSPRTTYSIRRPGKPICNAAIPAAASTPGNSAKRLPLRSRPRSPRSPARFPSKPPPAPALPGLLPASRHLSRPDSYSTSPVNCVAQARSAPGRRRTRHVRSSSFALAALSADFPLRVSRFLSAFHFFPAFFSSHKNFCSQNLSLPLHFFENLANTLVSVCAIHPSMQLFTKISSSEFASPHTLFRLLSYTASYFLP